jgi:uncharacterized protein (UPF0248 family)
MQVSNRSATKPIYLIVAEDPYTTDGFAFYKAQDLMETNAVLEFRGFLLTKKQAESIVKDPHAESAKTEKAVNRKIPWHRVIRIENTTYKIPQGENHD